MAKGINDYIFDALSTWAANGNLSVDASVILLTALPAADPHVVGQLYNASGTVKISAG